MDKLIPPKGDGDDDEEGSPYTFCELMSDLVQLKITSAPQTPRPTEQADVHDQVTVSIRC